jgi:hypothetical protein
MGDHERARPQGAGVDGVEGAGGVQNDLRDLAFVFEQLEILVRSGKDGLTGLALEYRTLDPLALSARLVDLSEALGDVRERVSSTVHHLRNCASEVLIGG